MCAAASPTSWHSDIDVYEAVKDFHDNCACPLQMDTQRAMHHQILGAIEKELRKEGLGTVGVLNRFEYVGSSYDGVKIGRDGFEFDIQVILKGGNTLMATEVPLKAGYYRLSPKDSSNNSFSNITGRDGFLSPHLAKQKFTGRLEKIIKTPELSQFHIKLVYHGPATEMDIYLDQSFSKRLYSVDMVPTFEIDGKQFVAKPFREEGSEAQDVWRISYSLMEKAKFDGLDRGNGCRKQVLRVCKAMRVDQSELKKITSYHLKNALFFEDDERGDQSDWRQEKLAMRVLGLWKRMENYLDRGFMPCYFNENMNLLEQIHPATKTNLRDRIRKFCKSKTEFLGIISRLRKLPPQ